MKKDEKSAAKEDKAKKAADEKKAKEDEKAAKKKGEGRRSRREEESQGRRKSGEEEGEGRRSSLKEEERGRQGGEGQIRQGREQGQGRSEGGQGQQGRRRQGEEVDARPASIEPRPRGGVFCRRRYNATRASLAMSTLHRAVSDPCTTPSKTPSATRRWCGCSACRAQTEQRAAGQARRQQSRRLGQGPARAVDDRRSREARHDQARRHADRSDLRQHRHRARDGRGDARLQDGAGDARAPVARAAPDDARLRRRDRPHAARRAAWRPRATSRRRCAPKARASSSTSSPTPTIRSSHYKGTGPEIWRDTEGRDHAFRVEHGHHRHDHGRRQLPEGEEPGDPDHRLPARGGLADSRASASGRKRICRRSTTRSASTGSSTCRRPTPRTWRGGWRARRASSPASPRAARARWRCASRARSRTRPSCSSSAIAATAISRPACSRADRPMQSCCAARSASMTPTLVFDIETVPDVAGLRRVHALPVEPDRRRRRSIGRCSSAAPRPAATSCRRTCSAWSRSPARCARATSLRIASVGTADDQRSRADPPLLRWHRQAHAAARVVERRRLRPAGAQPSRADPRRHRARGSGTGATTIATSSSTTTSAATTRATST